MLFGGQGLTGVVVVFQKAWLLAPTSANARGAPMKMTEVDREEPFAYAERRITAGKGSGRRSLFGIWDRTPHEFVLPNRDRLGVESSTTNKARRSAPSGRCLL